MKHLSLALVIGLSFGVAAASAGKTTYVAQPVTDPNPAPPSCGFHGFVASPHGLSNKGVVAAFEFVDDWGVCGAYSGTTTPFISINGTPVLLPGPLVNPAGSSGTPTYNPIATAGIDDNGELIGNGGSIFGSAVVPWFYSNGWMHVAAPAGACAGTVALAGVNNAGFVLGYSKGTSCSGGFTWQEGTGPSNWITPAPSSDCPTAVMQPAAINDINSIVFFPKTTNCGPVVLTADGQTTTYLLPAAAPSQRTFASWATINNNNTVTLLADGLFIWSSPTSATYYATSPAGNSIVAANTNNLGQTAFADSGGNVYVITNGVPQNLQAGVTYYTYDDGSTFDTGGFALNDATQVAFNSNEAGMVLVSPTQPSCDPNVTSALSITPKSITTVSTNVQSQNVVLKNTTPSAITGPLYLVLDNLTPRVTVGNGSVTLCAAPVGSYYVSASSNGLAPGASVTFAVKFFNASNQTITYTPRVLAGPAGR